MSAIIISVDRAEIDALNIDPLYNYLMELLKQPDHARSVLGRVGLAFGGYGEDTRPVYEIPKFRYYVNRLGQALPLWFYFFSTEMYTLRILDARLK